MYSGLLKKADFKKKAEDKKTSRNPSYVQLLTFNSVSCTLKERERKERKNEGTSRPSYIQRCVRVQRNEPSGWSRD